jgi:hypothetical protein
MEESAMKNVQIKLQRMKLIKNVLDVQMAVKDASMMILITV